MDRKNIIDELSVKTDSKIIMLVMDGLGGIPLQPDGKTELETAHKPNLNKIAPRSSLGLFDSVAPGVTPGSGPGHLGLFGYDPIGSNIGRGVLSALGINFNLEHGDLCMRINFCTIDSDGKVIDRRAGRIPNEECERLCAKLNEKIKMPQDLQLFINPVKEHRASVVLRGKDFYADIEDTDPQATGLLPLEPIAKDPEAGADTIAILQDIICQAKSILADEQKANMILLRGFAEFRQFPSMEERFKLKSLALAAYPMYRGLAKLIGMDVNWEVKTLDDQLSELEKQYDNYDFFFIHIKYTDSSGEDGDFARKVKVIEETDKAVPRMLKLNPDVFIVSCDHSTPAKMSAHSWHPVPTLIYSDLCRPDGLPEFDESNCRLGSLSRYESKEILPIAMAHAMKLKKFGA